MEIYSGKFHPSGYCSLGIFFCEMRFSVTKSDLEAKKVVSWLQVGVTKWKLHFLVSSLVFETKKNGSRLRKVFS